MYLWFFPSQESHPWCHLNPKGWCSWTSLFLDRQKAPFKWKSRNRSPAYSGYICPLKFLVPRLFVGVHTLRSLNAQEAELTQKSDELTQKTVPFAEIFFFMEEIGRAGFRDLGIYTPPLKKAKMTLEHHHFFTLGYIDSFMVVLTLSFLRLNWGSTWKPRV